MPVSMFGYFCVYLLVMIQVLRERLYGNLLPLISHYCHKIAEALTCQYPYGNKARNSC